VASDGAWHGRSLELEAWETRLAPRPRSIQPEDPTRARAVALLDAILASPASRPRHGEAVRDLMGTLRTLRLAIPGFASALSDRLPTTGPDDEATGCLRAVLAEPAGATPQPRGAGDKLGSPFRTLNLGTRYESDK
jgi:hypothetical protein